MCRKSCMIDIFFVTGTLRNAQGLGTSIRKGTRDLDYEIEVENCSGFPTNVTVEADMPQRATNLRFDGRANAWRKPFPSLQRDEARTARWTLDAGAAQPGTEPIHAWIAEYTDLQAGSVHKPVANAPLILTVTVF